MVSIFYLTGSNHLGIWISASRSIAAKGEKTDQSINFRYREKVSLFRLAYSHCFYTGNPIRGFIFSPEAAVRCRRLRYMAVGYAIKKKSAFEPPNVKNAENKESEDKTIWVIKRESR